ncbi:hypothetical protein T265_01920 [Opisthorchis viverrini]|uniref:Uncharacterized protein n=1 Tax=Opisthorchis viverrini TaxID=6198 RepID=A0A074ZX01_OPIVI|nr:hypothetical protein T265_01920 [Opisthorchis viverrini]KER31993.1 hypothetical protein T265_01920 [Opisthorchis viverrini]
MSPKKGETGRGLSKSFQQPSHRISLSIEAIKSLAEKSGGIISQHRWDPGMPKRGSKPLEGSTRTEILPGCPSLDSRSPEAGVGFEPRTFRSMNSRSNR